MAKYVTKTSSVKCSMGTAEDKLKIPKDHGVFIGSSGLALLNASDSKCPANIKDFGNCMSKIHPTYIAKSAAAAAKMSNPATASAGAAEQAQLDAQGVKCTPVLVTPWLLPHPDNLVSGVPALIDSSTLACPYLGVIEISEVAT